MGNLKNFLSVGVIFCVFALVNGGIFPRWEHHIFFNRLNDGEKRALMALAITSASEPGIENGDPSHIFPRYPIKPTADKIPKTLFTKMMNGGVPNKWMQEFIKWLKEKYDLDETSFKNYATGEAEQLCKGNNPTDCIPMARIQNSCCPFG